MNPFHIILAISLAANAALGWAYLGQRDNTTMAKVEERQAVGVALECSKGTEELAAKAEQRRQQAAPKVQAARKSAAQHNRKADQILATSPAVPGDACASAQAVVDDWWEKRK